MLLRVFIGEDARFHRPPAFRADRPQVSRGSFRGPMGFGHSTRLHSMKILDGRENLPLVIEIVDTEDNIRAFLPVLDSMMPRGL
jgi:uncharacterized protein